MKKQLLLRVLVSILAGTGLLLTAHGKSAAPPSSMGASFAYKPSQNPHGQTHGQWSARWWRWCMELPVDGHPASETQNFDVTAGQTGNVWYLAAPLVFDAGASVTRSATIPGGKSLFLALVAAEWSSLEGSPSEQEQREIAEWQADHIVPESLHLSLDGQALSNPSAYGFQSPQFAFDAPTPWLFGAEGGAGTAVGDGYYVFLKELSPGQHTLRYGGMLRFTLAEDGFDFEAWIDITYHLDQLVEVDVD